MKVVLLQHTPGPDSVVALAASQCYAEGFVADGRTPPLNLIPKILDNGHLSVLEHASFTFAVEGISRACSHQLVRHRLASFSQQSQRYVKGIFSYITPETIAQNDMFHTEYNFLMDRIVDLYNTMLSMGIPAEDARFILPNAAETKLIMTMNARELYHFFNVRCCTRAQWEIRNMADEMLRLVKRVAPMIFTNAGASCVTTGRCPEGTKTCGRV